jgi:hypothetical protein
MVDEKKDYEKINENLTAGIGFLILLTICLYILFPWFVDTKYLRVIQFTATALFLGAAFYLSTIMKKIKSKIPDKFQWNELFGGMHTERTRGEEDPSECNGYATFTNAPNGRDTIPMPIDEMLCTFKCMSCGHNSGFLNTDLVQRYNAGRPRFGVTCPSCGFATKIPFTVIGLDTRTRIKPNYAELLGPY